MTPKQSLTDETALEELRENLNRAKITDQHTAKWLEDDEWDLKVEEFDPGTDAKGSAEFNN
ncbi:hypothetical protein G6011_11305 [Alternaria panax]|uniref:Uncharacterized protein n=1 Tax=Alternaria panax TaxID=48097 RepID=A0AAD4IDS1_9PLEO|nr:hypothetical protein G6011_11305 [Alternaria panax]